MTGDTVKTPKTKSQRKTSTYSTWAAMLNRCRNPNGQDFAHYGGRNISVCTRWFSFDAFLEDMGEKPKGMSIERLDNSKDYCKENCRWATQKQQVRNRRNTLRLTHNGHTKSLADWCEELGVNYDCARERMSKGWPSERILSVTPFRTGPRVSPFKGKPRPNILRDPITKRFSGAIYGRE